MSRRAPSQSVRSRDVWARPFGIQVAVIALLCMGACAHSDGGNVPGPELVWKLYEPEPTYEALSIVGSGDGGSIVVAYRKQEAEPYHDDRIRHDVVLVKLDRWGSQIWEKVVGDETVMDSFGCVAEIEGGIVMAGTCRDDQSDELCLIRIDDEGDTVWHKTYEWRWRAESANLFGTPFGVLQTGDGGFVVVGSAWVWAGDPMGDWYMFKTDGDGRLLWNQTYGGMELGRADEYNPSKISAARDGGFIVVGDTSEDTGSPYGSVVVVKVDEIGEVVWRRDYGHDDSDFGSMVLRADGGYLVSGDGYTFMIDQQGNTVWQKPYGSRMMVRSSRGGFAVVWRHEPSYVPVYDIYMIDEDGNKVWEGTFEEYHPEEAAHGAWHWRSPFVGIVEVDDYGFVLAGDALGDLRVKKIDSAGGQVWDRIHGETVMVHDIAASPEGDYVVVGTTQTSGAGMRDGYLSGIDGQDGYRLWEKSYGGPGWDSLECITQSGDGGYVAAGYTTSFGDGGRDVYILRVDGEGYKIWEQAYGTSLQDNAIAIARCADGGFVVAGNTESYDGQAGYGYLVKVNAWGEKVWEKNIDHDPSNFVHVANMVPTRDGGFLVANMPDYGYAPLQLLKIDGNGHSVWEKTYPDVQPGYMSLLDTWITGNGDRFLVTNSEGPTFVVDGVGDRIWEKNCTEEFAMRFDYWMEPSPSPHGWGTLGSSVMPGSAALGVCDGGFILIHPVSHTGEAPGLPAEKDAILWRVTEEGKVVWATELTSLSNGTAWWATWIRLSVTNIVQGEGGTFAVVGNVVAPAGDVPLLRPEPFILKFKDPDLVGVKCPVPPTECEASFPALWNTVNAKFPLAKASIDAAKRRGTDPSLIDVMEMELAQAEQARDICGLESAQIHLEWIIQAAPEPHIRAAILLLPIYMAWRRTRRTRTPA